MQCGTSASRWCNTSGVNDADRDLSFRLRRLGVRLSVLRDQLVLNRVPHSALACLHLAGVAVGNHRVAMVQELVERDDGSRVLGQEAGHELPVLAEFREEVSSLVALPIDIMSYVRNCSMPSTIQRRPDGFASLARRARDR